MNKDLFVLYNHEESLAWAREEGFEEGFKEGFVEGFKEGFKEGFEEGFKETRREEHIKNTIISHVENGIDYKLSITLLMDTFQLSSEEAVQKYEMYKSL